MEGAQIPGNPGGLLGGLLKLEVYGAQISGSPLVFTEEHVELVGADGSPGARLQCNSGATQLHGLPIALGGSVKESRRRRKQLHGTGLGLRGFAHERRGFLLGCVDLVSDVDLKGFVKESRSGLHALHGLGLGLRGFAHERQGFLLGFFGLAMQEVDLKRIILLIRIILVHVDLFATIQALKNSQNVGLVDCVENCVEKAAWANLVDEPRFLLHNSLKLFAQKVASDNVVAPLHATIMKLLATQDGGPHAQHRQERLAGATKYILQ